jgi:GH25 family lysozyme M1 (1,4-beta-N-acetylmuramidase)
LNNVGLDVSKYNIGWNPDLTVKPISFVIQRASWSMYKDEKFDEMLVQVQKLDIRGAYHYYSSGVNWKYQADLFLSVTKDKGFHFYVLDYEGAYNNLNARTIAEASEFVKYVKQQTGKKCMIYFSPNIFNTAIRPYGYASWANAQDVWIAQYPFSFTENPLATKPALPVGLTTWKIWQYGGGDVNYTAGRHAGSSYGGGTVGIDLNTYNGTIDEMKLWLGINSIPEIPVGPPVVIVPPVGQPATTMVNVNVRSGPSTSWPIIAPSIPAGTKVSVLKEERDSLGNTWGNVIQGWCAMIYNGATYIKYDTVVVPPPPPPPIIVPPIPPQSLVKTFIVPLIGEYWQTLHDYENPNQGYKPRSISKNYKSDPPANALPETIPLLNKKEQFFKLSEKWQFWWLDLLRLASGGSFTEVELKRRWKSLTANYRAFTDFHAVENGYCDFVLGINLGAEPIALKSLTTGGNMVKVLGVNGTLLTIECLNFNATPPPIEDVWEKKIWLYQWATQESVLKLADGKYKILPFPQMSPYGTPVPVGSLTGTQLISKTYVKKLINGNTYPIY